MPACSYELAPFGTSELSPRGLSGSAVKEGCKHEISVRHDLVTFTDAITASLTPLNTGRVLSSSGARQVLPSCTSWHRLGAQEVLAPTIVSWATSAQPIATVAQRVAVCTLDRPKYMNTYLLPPRPLRFAPSKSALGSLFASPIARGI